MTGTVLVTGATGFAGRHLLAELAARGLTAVATGYRGAAGEPGDPPGREGDPPSLDLRDAAATRRLVRKVGPAAVVHLAGQSSAGVPFASPRDTFEANVLGTWNLLAAVRDEAREARVLVITSADLYGPSAPGAPHVETAPFRPVSPYGASKAAQDLIAALAAASYRLAVIRVRPFPHAGPGQRPTFALPAFAAQIAASERGAGEPVLRAGNLEVIRDYTDVRDVARAYADLLARGEPGEAYNVCTGRGRKLGELVERLAAAARVPVRIEVDPARLRPADLPHLVGDPGKLAAATGFAPRIEIERTLADLLDEARARPAPAPAPARGAV